MHRRIDAQTVTVLADAQGHPEFTPAFAERVAAGADRAVSAVRDSVTETLFDLEPAAFLDVLEDLAPDEQAL